MDIRNGLVARNTALNLAGLVLPLAVGFVTIPLVVRALGTERFGILALVWVVFGYFGLFDLGLGRTTTKFVADALGRNEPGGLPARLWTAVLLQTAIGLAAALLCWLAAPLIVRGLLNIPAGFVEETILTIRLVGLSLPVMFVSSSFRGVLEAAQRFDLVNAVKAPANVLFYVLPLAGAAFGYALPGIVILLLASRVGALAVWAYLAFRAMPALRARPAWEPGLVRPLFSFSGWLGLSGVLYAVTTSLDRLVIGSLLTVEAVAFYSAPYEAISRVGVVPGSLGMVLFPAFSFLDGGRQDARAEELFGRSAKLMLLSTGPVLVGLAFFAGDVLRLWLGPEFAARGAFAVTVLAVGFLVNTVAAVPNNYLLGIGRADLAPKYQAVELPVFTALTWAGAKLGGIGGVAAATALRLAAFTAFLMVMSSTAGRIRFGLVWKSGLAAVVAALAFLAAGLGASAVLGLGVWGAAAATLAFAAVAWSRCLDAGERAFLRGLPGSLRRPSAVSAAAGEERR